MDERVLRQLYETLQGRAWPEGVLRTIVDKHDGLDQRTFRTLESRARYSGRAGYSLMPELFNPPESLMKTANTLAMLLDTDALSEDDGRDPRRLSELLDEGYAYLGMTKFATDFKHDRLNRAQRQAKGYDLSWMSKRRYNKLFRLVARLQRETTDLTQQLALYEMGRFAKTSFASKLSWENFSADVETACFVAYMTANLGRRSIFTNGKQARAFDETAQLLFDRLERSATTNWAAVATVFPRMDVLGRVSPEDRVALLGMTFTIMQSTAKLLEQAAKDSEIDVQTMVVKRGNDSSTWNALAGAWNRARDYWIALMTSLGRDDAFESFMPGKVMRLMAADVAYWHRRSGGGLDPDTHLWALLPKPWEVVLGDAQCTRSMIYLGAVASGVRADQSGWVAPKVRTKVERWMPTPELVHGVEVRDPMLAWWFRKIGIFSGQKIRQGQADAYEAAGSPRSIHPDAPVTRGRGWQIDTAGTDEVMEW